MAKVINLCCLAICLVLISSVTAVSLSRRNSWYKKDDSSCEGRCNSGVLPGAPCQCNSACERYDDCCEDYKELCVGTCENKCGNPHDSTAICQCNKACANHDDCCPDYNELCADDVTDEQLKQIAEELLALDYNNAAEFVTVNDHDASPLLTARPEAYLKPTISKFVALFDNYYVDVRDTEDVTDEELEEEDEFLNEVFATPLMQRAQEFLLEKDLPNGRENLYKLWFGLYNRGTGRLGSSGFEHVFLGEIMNGISGFHNWLYFIHEEKNGNIINPQITKLIDFDDKGWAMENRFTWLNATKPIGGGFIGTSPEFELAIYTICFHARPNSLCPITLNGQRLNIQTYKTGASHSSTDTFISTSYTIVP